MALVRDIMETNVLCLSPDMPLEEAARALAERQVGAAPVCTPEGRVIGVLSKTDITELFGPAGEARRVREAMTEEVLSVPPEAPIETAIRAMAFEGVHRLAVLDAGGRLAGIVSAMDVLRQLAGFPRRDERVVAVAPQEDRPPADPGASRFERILVATDLGECSLRALDIGVEMASRFDATLILMHCCEQPVGGEGRSPDAAMIESIQEGVRKVLDDIVVKTRARWPRTEAVLHTGGGAPWQQVLRTIDDTKADLVVIGTHGWRGVDDALLGSVAEKVVRMAPVPVMTVRVA